MTRFHCSVFISLLLLRPVLGTLEGAAWPLPKGNGQVFFNVTGYRAGGTFDSSGYRKPFQYDGRFRQYIVNPYFEYGLTKRMTLVGNLFFPSLTYTDQYNRFHSAGSGDMEFGVRYLLTESEAGIAWSVQGMVKAPTYSAARSPAPGNRQMDYEVRILAGRSFLLRSFWNVEAGYRIRTAAPANQVRLDLTYGTTFKKRWMGLAQAFIIKSVEGGYYQANPTNNPNIVPSFDLYKTQLSLVYTINRKTRIQGGWTFDVYGRNVGAGNGFLASLWREF